MTKPTYSEAGHPENRRAKTQRGRSLFWAADTLASPPRVHTDLMRAIPQNLKDLASSTLQHPPATWDLKEVVLGDVVGKRRRQTMTGVKSLKAK